MQDHIVSRRVTRFFAGWMICGGVLGGVAVGLAATANATTGSDGPQVRGPQIVATPHTTAPQWVPPRHRLVIVRSDAGGE